VLLGELSDLTMLEPQDRFDLFVGKTTRAARDGRLPQRTETRRFPLGNEDGRLCQMAA
jgi:hypothetical protein